MSKRPLGRNPFQKKEKTIEESKEVTVETKTSSNVTPSWLSNTLGDVVVFGVGLLGWVQSFLPQTKRS